MKLKRCIIFIISILSISCKSFKDAGKGDLWLDLSVPYVNNFYFNSENEEPKVSTGFWGLAAGIDYYHSENQFVSLKGFGAVDFFLPVPAAIDYSGDEWEDEFIYSFIIAISNNHRINRFNLGYGLSFASNSWDNDYYSNIPESPARDNIHRIHSAFGLFFPVYYRITKFFNVGIIYRPTFFRPSMDDKFKYEHLLSLDCAFKLPIYRANRSNN
jgi:hypothetical protein